MLSHYTCVKQHDITDCGAACLSAIAAHYGLWTSVGKIREMAGTDKHGTNAYGMIKAAKKIGFEAKGVRGDVQAFFSGFSLPCIAHVIVNGELLHYVVIHKITRKQVILADPGAGIVKLSPEEFFGTKIASKNRQNYQWTGVLILVTPGPGFKKGNKKTTVSRWLLTLVGPQKKLLARVFAASLMYTVLNIMGAFYFKWIIDDILPGRLMEELHILSAGVILLYLLRVLLNAYRAELLVRFGKKLDEKLLFGYYSHVLGLPVGFFGTRRAGEILSRFQDASKVRETVSGAALTIMIDTIMVLAGGIILYQQNPYMFSITFLVSLFYGLTVTAFNKWYKRLNEKQMEENAGLTSYMVETINGIETVKSYHAEEKTEKSAKEKLDNVLDSIVQLGRVMNLESSLAGFIKLAGETVVLWSGAYQAMQGNITAGQLVTFYTLFMYFLQPVKNLIDLQPQLQTALAASRRLIEVLEAEPEDTGEEGKEKVDSLKGDISVHNITFRYGMRQAVLKDLSLHIKQGQHIALIGESGSGKTTLARLLLHFYTIEEGSITIAGKDIERIRLECLRNRICYISQETFLFSGTIFENLTLGMEKPDREAVILAAKKAQAHQFISQLPLQYETRLEENGNNLSGGQRQRLAIARAMLKNPDILILDEATSNLDSITENAIDKALEEYGKGKTIILIAHRLSTVRSCDVIYVMKEGNIAESGSHRQLLEKNGLYAGMWEKYK